MKKILLGSATAVCAIVGSSSFKKASTGTAIYYIFEVIAGSQSAPIGINKSFDNTMVEGAFLATVSLSTTDDQFTIIGCNGNAEWCAVAFTRDQIVTDDPGSLASKWKLITNSTIPSQPNEQFAMRY